MTAKQFPNHAHRALGSSSEETTTPRLPRRALLRGLASGAALSLLPREAAAKQWCQPISRVQQRCEVGIDSRIASIFAGRTGGQHMSQWCWAACIEMVFRYYGHPVDQADIVSQTWGGLVNNPGRPDQILANLNRPWRDQRGRVFRAYGDVFSANPQTAAADLAQDAPLIIGTLGHAMVLTGMSFLNDVRGGGSVQSAVVRDPWPGNGRRVLSAREWYSTNFLARIRVA